MASTKILATLGPASFDKVEELIRAGVDGFRFNMAHTKPEDYESRGKLAKKIRGLYATAFLSADLEGPKIRLGYFEPINIHVDDEVCIVPTSSYHPSDSTSRGRVVPIQYEELYKHIKKGNALLVDDGKARLIVKNIDKRNRVIHSIVEYGEVLESRKGINVPGIRIPLPVYSENDPAHIKFLIENDFDFIFLSYTRSAKALNELGEKLKGTGIRKGGKPENQEGADNLEEIIRACDIMMIPRGDWGMEMGVEKIPTLQKMTIQRCNQLGIPVVTATQMAESMLASRELSRADTSDIFNACLDGTDITMLSGETSKGKYPVEAVKAMNGVLEEAEKYLFNPISGINLGERVSRLIPAESFADIVSQSVYSASKSPNIAAIIVPTSTGYTARMISRFRIDKPVIAVTYNAQVRRQLNALWGGYSSLN